MNVLVMGGTGYIGSHAAKLLDASGHRAVTLDNVSTGYRELVRWGPFIHGDLEDSDLLRQVLVQFEIEAVIHFAANAYVGESMTNPRTYFRNNVLNTLNLLDAMLDVGTKHIIFSSTCAVYGLPQQVPTAEDAPKHPTNPYGESKLFIERALQWYGQAYELSWIALRYFNAAGADPNGELGEIHDPETHLIPLVVRTALGQRPYLEVYGTDYPTPDGTAIRDYFHVTDLARAHVMALDPLYKGGTNSSFNLGIGHGYSVREVVRAIEAVSGCPVPIEERERRIGDPPALVAASERSTTILGWTPQFSDLRTIGQTAWDWHRHSTSATFS